MADQDANEFPLYQANAGVGSWPIADGIEVFDGMFCGLEGGYLNHWADGTGDVFLGILERGDVRIPSGPSSDRGKMIGETSDDIPPEAQVDISGATLRSLSIGGTATQAKVGDPVYCATSNRDDITLTVGSHKRAIGWMSRYRSATDVDVTLHPASKFAARAEMGGITSLTDSTGGSADDTVQSVAPATTLTDSTGDSSTHDDTLGAVTEATALTDSTGGTTTTTLAVGAGVYELAFPIALAGITGAADVVTDYIIGHKFKVISLKWVTTTVASTGAKNATITAEIGATPITSISIVLDSDLAITTTMGGVTTVDATGANTGSATDTLSIVAGTVTAFVEGSGCLIFEIQNMDTADAFAGMVTETTATQTAVGVMKQNSSDTAQKVIELVTWQTAVQANLADLTAKINEILATE